MSPEPRLLARGAVEIHRPVHETWAYVSNLENFPAWFPGVAAVRSLDTLEHAQVGKRYRETLRLPFGRSDMIDIEVKEVRAGEHLLTEGGVVVLARMTMELAAIADGTTCFAWQMVSRNERWWFRRLLLPLLRRVMARRAREGLRRLRANLERGGSAPPDRAPRNDHGADVTAQARAR